MSKCVSRVMLLLLINNRKFWSYFSIIYVKCVFFGTESIHFDNIWLVWTELIKRQSLPNVHVEKIFLTGKSSDLCSYIQVGQIGNLVGQVPLYIWINMFKWLNSNLLLTACNITKKQVLKSSYPSRLLSLERERSFLRSPERDRCDLERLLRLLLRDLWDL